MVDPQLSWNTTGKNVKVWKIVRWQGQPMPFYQGVIIKHTRDGILIKHQGTKGTEYRFVPWNNIDDIEVQP